MKLCWLTFLLKNEHFHEDFLKVFEDKSVKEVDDFMENGNSNMELALPHDREDLVFARVMKQMKDDNENPVGREHQNPILGSRTSEVEFLDESTPVPGYLFMSTDMSFS